MHIFKTKFHKNTIFWIFSDVFVIFIDFEQFTFKEYVVEIIKVVTELLKYTNLCCKFKHQQF